MGKAAKAVTKTVSKAVSSATKAVGSVVKSSGKAIESTVSSAKHLAQGDVKGAVRKLTDVAANAGNVASMGTVDLTGRKQGVINIDKNKYVDSVIGVAKEKSAPAVSQTDLETDGLLQYVADLRTRKSRRNRASTVNTDGSASNNLNKLGGTTALGV